MCKTTSPSSLQLATNCVCCKWSFQMIRPCRAKSLPLGGARDVVAGRDVRVYTRATLSLSLSVARKVYMAVGCGPLSLYRGPVTLLSLCMNGRKDGGGKGTSKKKIE